MPVFFKVNEINRIGAILKDTIKLFSVIFDLSVVEGKVERRSKENWCGRILITRLDNIADSLKFYP